MKIVILGAGDIGSYAAQVLSQQEHDVIIIDRDPKVLDQIGRDLDVQTVLASSSLCRIITQLSEGNPNLFFAATGHDETNLTACALAKNLGYGKTVARIKSPEYMLYGQLNLSRLFYIDHLIGAEMLSANALFKLLIHTGDIAFEQFAHGAVIMRTVCIPEKWDRGGTPIRSLHLPPDLIAGLIRRKQPEGDKIMIPHGSDHILPGDEVTLVGEAKVMDKLHHLFSIPEPQVKSVVLIGGSTPASYLAQLLIKQRVSVRIVEKNYMRCRELAELIPEATIINRDGLDPNLFVEEQFELADALVCCTADDGTNLLIGSMAKQLGCQKVIAVANNPVFTSLLERSDLSTALSGRINVANRLLSILHEETILSVNSLSNDAAKIVEIKVSPSSKLLGIPLSAMSHHLPQDLLVAIIENHGKVMIGKGESILCSDDTVIAICSPHQTEQLKELFSS